MTCKLCHPRSFWV